MRLLLLLLLQLHLFVVGRRLWDEKGRDEGQEPPSPLLLEFMDISIT
jgi:hypothetical protein